MQQVSDDRLWKSRLHAFRNRLYRSEYGKHVRAVIWKLEFQERGAAHYHLVVVWKGDYKPDLCYLGAWIAFNWNQVAEPGDEAHLRHGTDCQGIRAGSGGEMRALMRYLSKYVAKAFEHEGNTGRIWGIWGDLPQQLVADVGTTWADYVKLVRRIRKWGRGSSYLQHMTAVRTGFSIWYDGEQLEQLLRGLTRVEYDE